MAVPLDLALANLYQSIISGFPTLVYAILVLAVGYIIGRIVGIGVERILLRIKLDAYVTEHEHLALNLHSIFSIIAKWWVYLITLQSFSAILGIPAIMLIVGSIIDFIPGVVGAIIIMIVSYAIAIYAKESVLGSKELYSNIVGKIIFFLIVYIGIATALPLLGVNTYLINAILLLIIGSVSVGLAIALGWGLKDVVSQASKDAYAKRAKKMK